MLWTQAGCVFMGFILCISEVQGQKESICALKGSTVHLNCLAENLTSSTNWFTVYLNHSELVLNELSADGKVMYNMSGEDNSTLTIKDLRESDEKSYCCGETTEGTGLWERRTELHVADLQVKVIPTTEGHTVTLMCSTSCTLTKNPVTYIWYKNREYLYHNWSPWYQELVSSDDTVRYSCAVKGYEDLRAPEVSVDAITSTCFSVTYAKGKMCSYQHQSEDEPCSITFPTELQVKKTAVRNYFKVTCDSSCPALHPRTSYVWYWNRKIYNDCESQHLTLLKSFYDMVSCALKGHDDLYSDNFCPRDDTCIVSNYISRRICVLEGLSVNISSKYFDSRGGYDKSWSKRHGEKNLLSFLKEDGHVEFDNSMKNVHMLRINNVEKNDSGLYVFKVKDFLNQWEKSEQSIVTLVVTGLQVTMIPSAVLTEGQRVTLTCTTSCPLPEDTAYTWYLNSQPLTLPGNRNKHLILEPVGSEHAGNYSCAVVTAHNIRSSDEALIVNSHGKLVLVLNAIKLILILLVLPAVFLLYKWMRKKTHASTAGEGDTSQTGQNLVYESIPLGPINRAAPMDPAAQ